MRNLRRTNLGYDPTILVSMVQKAVRRNRPDLAGFAACELLRSGYAEWCWRRITVTAAEDCASMVVGEVLALRDACSRERKARRGPPTRVFICRAVLLLCKSYKCRDADALGLLVIDGAAIDDNDVAALAEEAEAEPEAVPDFVLDCHTREGRRCGKTKKQFMREERAALEPVCPGTTGLFDHLIPK